MSKAAASKASKKPRAVAQTATKPKSLFSLMPWSCRHHSDRSEIEAYVMGSGKNEIIAEVRPSGYVHPETTANFIVKAVNDYEKHQTLIEELMSAIELCLESGGLSWEAEQEAELALRHAKQRR